MSILDAKLETIGAIKSKADYISDLCIAYLSATSDSQKLPALVAENYLRQLESFAENFEDTIGSYLE